MLNTKTLGCILLMSCTTIGGGVLAMPTNTVNAGFLPSVLVLTLCWAFMLFASFALLEVNLWFKEEVNIISMAKATLGTPGQVVAWVSYLLLLAALFSAYLTGSCAWMEKLLKEQFHIYLPDKSCLAIIVLSLAALIHIGTSAVDMLNRVVSIALFIAFGVLVYLGLPEVDPDLVRMANKVTSLAPKIPLFITSFGSAIVLPTIVDYTSRNRSELFKIVFVGSLIPLIMYIVWEWLTLGILSIPGPNGLQELASENANSSEVANSLALVLENKYITTVANLFSVSAILTSLFGVAISLYHFLSDGLKIPHKGMGSIFLLILTFAPPCALVLFFPSGFDTILSVGGIFVAVLLGLVPIAMCWSGRYCVNLSDSSMFRVAGGKLTLTLASLFFILVIFIRASS